MALTTTCDNLLSANIGYDCADPVVKGLRAMGYLCNYDDVDKDAVEITDNVISSFALKSGKKAYRIAVPNTTPFNGTKTSMVAGTYRNTFDKTVQFVILDNGKDVTGKIIDKLANGKFVAILENEYSKGGDNAFEVYGYEQGLKASALENDKYSADTEGGWMVTMTETQAPRSGIYFLSDDIEQTRSALEAMVTA